MSAHTQVSTPAPCGSIEPHPDHSARDEFLRVVECPGIVHALTPKQAATSEKSDA